MNKFILLLLLIFSLISAEERPLVILSHDRPPFHFTDESGNVVGICIDIVDTILREMDIPYEIHHMSWARVWQQIVQGKGEASFTTSRKAPREPYLLYPKTDMWVSEFTFFFREENRIISPNGTYEEVAASGETVGIERGASYDTEFWKHFPNTDGTSDYDPDKFSRGIYNEQLHPVNNIAQALKMLSLERLTYVLEDKTVGQYYIAQHNIDSSVIFYETPRFSKGYPMPFIKNSDYPNVEEVAREFEQRLIKLKEDGRYQKIFDKWLKKSNH